MTALTPDAIMLATEDVLRRYGPAKATVVDVARALGVSHAAVYRHFPSKTALREAVTRRWLARADDRLTAGAHLPPPERLRAWLTALYESKRHAATGDPELFATYRVLAEENSAVAAEHVHHLLRHLEEIVTAGVATGDFAVDDPAATARAIFEATAAFHHPAHAADWTRPDREALLADICTLIANALRP